MLRNSLIVYLFISIICLLVDVQAADLPEYLKRCNISDPELYKCVEENIEVLKSKLKNGVPELFIPTLDPLVVPPTCVNEEDQVKVTFKDIQIYNVNDFKLDQFDIDLDNSEVNLTFSFPLLRIKSTYNVNGKFLVVTFDENGPADGNYTNFKIHLDLKGTSNIKNEKKYMEWKKEKISIEIEKSHVVLENLFGNHTDIADKTNKIINENIDTIINDLQPVIRNVVSDFIFGIVNKLFSNYSVKELFLNV